MGSRGAPNKPRVYETGYLEVVEAPKQSSASSTRASATGSGNSGNSAAGYKEPSDYSIYKSYGGQQNFLHSHGLKLHNPGDIAEGKQIVAEIKREMREAAQAPTNYSRK